MIPGIPSLGGTELLIILAIVLLFFGAKRVPELAKGLGKGIREFRQGAAEVGNDATNKDQVKDQVRDEDSSGKKPSPNGATQGGAPLSTEEVQTTRSGER